MSPDPDAPRPILTAERQGSRRLIAAVDAQARALGLHPGMAVAQAQAMLPNLDIAEADPQADLAALRRLAVWCLRRFTPLAAPDPPDGLWLDMTGCTHLFGGETALLTLLTNQFAQAGITARAGLAATPGAAHALARFGVGRRLGQGALPPGPPLGSGTPDPRLFCSKLLHHPTHKQTGVWGPLAPAGVQGAEPPGLASPPPRSAHTPAEMLDGLPVAALRLEEGVADALHRLGFETIGQLARAPRAPLSRRFGPGVIGRLDQAFGRVPEPIEPVAAAALPRSRMAFPEPIATPEDLARAVTLLAQALCDKLLKRGLGAGRLDLVFRRVDGEHQAIRIGTAAATRDSAHLIRLLLPRIETIDPGFGIEAAMLTAVLTDRLEPSQEGGLAMPEARKTNLAGLVDVLRNRLGDGRLFRVQPVESDLPERSARRVAPLASPSRQSWPGSLPRPTRLFDPPRPVEAISLLPDQPPVRFIWHRKTHRILRADGPERVFGEWWRDAVDGSDESWAVRDYFQVEDEAGQRFWLFRRGDGEDPSTGDLRWFLHGVFG